MVVKLNTFTIPASWLSRPVDVVLVGCGGTGSEVFDELFRIHSLLISLGGDGLTVTVYDPDTVSEANIGRQRFWPADVGYYKAEIMVNRVNNYGGTNWDFRNKSFSMDDWGYGDLLITCVDKPEVRASIGQCTTAVHNLGDVLWLDCGNDSHSGNVILGHLSKSANSGIQLPNVFDLYPCLASMEGIDEPSCSTSEALFRQDYGINRSVAREAANIIWQLIRHGSISNHGSYIDIRKGTVTPLRIDPSVWACYT